MELTHLELEQCKRLAVFFEGKRLTQREIAKSLNFSEPYLSAMLKGHRPLTMAVVKKLVAVYNIDVDWLINGTNQAGEEVPEYNTSLPGAFNTFYRDIINRVNLLEIEQKRITEVLMRHNIS